MEEYRQNRFKTGDFIAKQGGSEMSQPTSPQFGKPGYDEDIVCFVLTM